MQTTAVGCIQLWSKASQLWQFVFSFLFFNESFLIDCMIKRILSVYVWLVELLSLWEDQLTMRRYLIKNTISKWEGMLYLWIILLHTCRRIYDVIFNSNARQILNLACYKMQPTKGVGVTDSKSRRPAFYKAAKIKLQIFIAN